MQMVVNELLVHYQKTGKGKIVLLLHGWGDAASTFEQLAKDLTSHFTVLIPDLPGFGQTTAPSVAWDLDNYADFVREFLNKLGHDNVHGVLGHSNGGALAIRSLATGKLRSDKLILLASAGIRDRQKVQRLGLKVVAKTGKAATVFLPNQTRQKLRKKLYGVVGSDMYVAPHIQETFKRTVRQDMQADAKNLQLPTLLIYGAKDSATPVLYGQIYHKLIKNSRLEIVPNAGHFVHHEQSEKINELVQEFLK